MVKASAQLGFCTGNSGDPIFIENFGIGLGNNPLPPGTTTYPFASGYPNDGFYTVTNGTFSNSFDWHATQDHTPNDTNGKCLIVNAAAGAGEFYRRTVSGLCETTTYEFSAWVINLVRANSFCSGVPGGSIPINVRFEIWDSTDTILIKAGNTGNILETSSVNWQEFGLVFQTLVAQNTVILKMINNGQGGCGNDLAIDDIEFKSCGDAVVLTDSNNNNSVTLCSTQAPYISTLTTTPDFSVYSSHFYQWQESTDNGVTWNDLPGAINQSIPISVSNTTYYRTKVAEVAVNLNNPQCVSFSNTFQVTINQLPITPTLACWQMASINITTCSWDITGMQPAQPVTQCWQTANFNSVTCSWDITGTQPIQPVIQCWETATFNSTTCSWDITGTQPVQPTTQCWESAMFNTATCTWNVTGSQPIQPVGIQCWESVSFNTTTCLWVVTGVQPVQPVTQCWETAMFNATTCSWDVTGTQPNLPTLAGCWESANFNNTSCSWDINGTQPIQPTGLQCWETTAFNTATCSWDVTGTQPVDNMSISLCENENIVLKPITTATNPTYLWSNGEVSESISVTTAGAYDVEIANNGCLFVKRTYNVTQIDNPIIDTIHSDGNDIIITTSNSGDFLYSLNGNLFQPNNIFSNQKGGLYTIYVKGNNCTTISTKQYLHFYIPKFFTPNNDGINDTFSLSGIEYFGSSEVSIFDRYGKLLKNAVNTSFSWNGTFNNMNLPSDDYWYVIVIDGQQFSGHISLKR